MNRVTRALLLVGLALVLAGGAALVVHFQNGRGTVRVAISQAMIDRTLAARFPRDRTYLKIIRVAYANPAATLLPGSDRIRVALEVRVDLGVKGLAKSYQGGAALTTGVGYRHETHEFFLQDAQVESLDIPKLTPRELAVIRDGLNLVADEWLRSVTVYQLTDRDTKHRLARLVLRDIEVRGDRVEAVLGL